MPSGPGNTSLTPMGHLLIMLWLLICLSLVPFSKAHGANVQTQLSASTISIDESVTLTVLASGLDGELDTSALEKDFEVIGRSSSRQIDNLNGQITNTRNWVLELMPKRTGIFTVPPVLVDGVASQLLSLTVSDAPTGADRQLFVEATVDKSEPWVQSQLILTLRVFQAVSILDGSLGEPEAADLIVRPLGEDRRFNAERDGRSYDVLERRFALFPQTSGRLEIAPITLIASVPSNPNRVQGFFPDTRRLTRRTQPVMLEVQARPPGGSGWWLPARDVTIDSSWAEDIQDARVDQPLTREVQLRAAGVSDAQLPTIQTPIVEGAGIYADDPVRGTQAGADGLSATQKVTWAVIPQRVGILTLPAIDIDWFDTATGQARTASLPQEIIEVKPALSDGSAPSTAGSAATASGATADLNESPSDLQGESVASVDDSGAGALVANDTRQDAAELPGQEGSALLGAYSKRPGSAWFWRLLAAAALIGWGVTGLFLYRARRRVASGSAIQDELAARSTRSANASLEEVRQASMSGSVAELSVAVLAWAKCQWQLDPPLSLTEISRRLESAEASDALRQLDAALYRPNASEPDMPLQLASQLADRLEAAVPRQSQKAQVSDRRHHLPNL